ncbi:MAG: hypothetical protein J5928_01490 [Firmicutes bacterium]|nr:hypothetical protein [Bacillota bacterium]
MDSMPPIVPIIISMIIISNIVKLGKAAKNGSNKGVGNKNLSPTRGSKSSPGTGVSSRTQTMSQGTGTSAPPKSWQVGKSNVKPVLNGKTGRGKAFGQRPTKSNYDSAFEDRGIFFGGTIAAFGEERDIISKESMAARNAEYIDVGNDYVSSFDVGGRRETETGFDR